MCHSALMETIFTTFSYIVFLLLGYYLAKTKEEKKELHQSARKIFPQKKENHSASTTVS